MIDWVSLTACGRSERLCACASYGIVGSSVCVSVSVELPGAVG